MSESWEHRASHSLSASAESTKRQTVATACERCRTKKVKCDGRRPCSECVRRGVECNFSAREDETPKQAAKRKYDELNQAHDDLKDLFQYLAGGSHAEASDLFLRVRGGQSFESVLRYARQRDQRDPPRLSYEQRLRQSFLTMIAQSTGTLHDINNLARVALDRRCIGSLPPPEAYARLRDRIITLPIVSHVLGRAESINDAVGLAVDQPPFDIPDGLNSGPLFWVPASPWTELTSVDESVSHLISIFLVHLNPWYRCVETDLFLRDMRRGHKSAEYCSPFLVNAILAWASLFAESEDAFFTPGQYLTRGQHFHDEALRLWQMEDGRASITNMQALAVLSLEGSLRGQDKEGVVWIASAVTLNQSLPNAIITISSNRAARDYARARASTWWLLVYLDVTFAVGLLRRSETVGSNFLNAPRLEDYLPDALMYVSGYPATWEPKPLRTTQLLRARCELTRYVSDVVNLVLPSRPGMRRPDLLVEAVQKLREDLSTWYDRLPAGIRYSKDMPECLFELHGQYACTQIVLHRQAALELFEYTRDAESIESPIGYEEIEADLHRHALKHAFDAVAMLRDYREICGLKIVRLMVVNSAMISVFILLHELRKHPPRRGISTSEQDATTTATLDAFVECFRCLLGVATQLMLPRGVARMVYRTALMLKIDLPDVVVQTLDVMAETAWKPMDADQLNSGWLNWALIHSQAGRREDLEMGQLLRKWERLDIRDQEEPVMLDWDDQPSSRGTSSSWTN